MYSIEEYGRMIGDRTRTGAYAEALRRAIKPGSTVLDLGAGTGIFSLLACQYGARKVYAVEPSDAIEIGRRIAHANGFAGRIEFLQGLSTEIALADKVDVIVADMHGTLPFYHSNVASLIDARRRLLAGGGVLIPRRDSLWAAVVRAPEEYDELVSPWARDNFGLDMDAARQAVINCLRKASVRLDQLLSEPQCWGMLDYAVVEQPSHAATASFSAARAGIAHGLILWFDSFLADGIELSNAPGAPTLVYSSSLLPWSTPVPLEAGDAIEVRLRADFTGSDYTWSWDSKVKKSGAAELKADFRQSSFWGTPLSAIRLHRRGAEYRPAVGEDGKLAIFVLSRMNGATPLAEIARSAMRQFPERFHSFDEALARVGDLSDLYGHLKR
jgi:protein arginine N-methyltransferase 1